MADIGMITPARPVWPKKPQIEEKEQEGRREQEKQQDKKENGSNNNGSPDEKPHIDVTV
jgi:hypothetical protein